MFVEKVINFIKTNEIPEEMEYLSFHQHRFEYIFSILNRYNKNQSILNIGAHYLHEATGAYIMGFKNLYGIDLEMFNRQTLSRAKNIGAVIKNCNLVDSLIPFQDNNFDIVLMNETLEHFNFHPRKVFKEIYRVLKPGGEAIITTPNLLRLNNRLKMILGKSINFNIEKTFDCGTHYREYSAKEIKYLFESTGFKIKKLKYIDFDYPNRKKTEKIIKYFICTALKKLKSNICIVAKKV